MQKIILSPPFSNISFYSNVTKIVGSYTLKPRRGLWRVLTTLRFTKLGIINRVGLRNPGIDKCKDKPNIVSIAALKLGDWDLLLDKLSSYKNILGVEFNISCPNASVLGLTSKIIERANSLFDVVIVKVPNLISLKEIDDLMTLGDFILHISNTRKLKSGGLSGSLLMRDNINRIKYVKRVSSRAVIAGGGIYSLSDIYTYRNAGADYFSLSTVLLNPFKTKRIIKSFYAR